MHRNLSLCALALVVALVGPVAAQGATHRHAHAHRSVTHARGRAHRRSHHRRHHRVHRPLAKIAASRPTRDSGIIWSLRGGNGAGTAPTGRTVSPGGAGSTSTFPQGVAGTVCSLIASPSGSDATGTGSPAAPFATLQKLDASLSPGQTGCLESGTYGSTTTHFKLATSGTAAAPITITSYPGQTATVQGWVDIEGGYQVIEHLAIDESNSFYTLVRSGISCPTNVSEGLNIAGPNVTLQYDNVFQSQAGLRSVGIGVGWWGDASNTTLRFNKIHDTGQCDNYDHSVYLASGSNIQVYGNWLWHNHGGQAFSIYPNVVGASVHSNVIDSSDSGFTIGDNGGSNSTAGVSIYHNIVSNSGTLANHDDGWSIPGMFINCDFQSSSSRGNRADSNDSYNNPGGSAGCGAGSIAVSGLSTTNPGYVDAPNHDYALTASSPFSSWGIWDGSNS